MKYWFERKIKRIILTWLEADPFSQKDTFSNRKRYLLTENNYSKLVGVDVTFGGKMGMGVQCLGEDDVTSFLFCVVN